MSVCASCRSFMLSQLLKHIFLNTAVVLKIIKTIRHYFILSTPALHLSYKREFTLWKASFFQENPLNVEPDQLLRAASIMGHRSISYQVNNKVDTLLNFYWKSLGLGEMGQDIWQSSPHLKILQMSKMMLPHTKVQETSDFAQAAWTGPKTSPDYKHLSMASRKKL